MSEKRTVKMVTEDMAGDVLSPCSCPITRAVKRQFPEWRKVLCGFSYVKVSETGILDEYRTFILPPEAEQLQNKLMEGQSAAPITFDMEEEIYE